jgi:hypothetical protein
VAKKCEKVYQDVKDGKDISKFTTTGAIGEIKRTPVKIS